jgi:integral membrane sensor domain MASE1/CheY-like chemotaxis protein
MRSSVIDLRARQGDAARPRLWQLAAFGAAYALGGLLGCLLIVAPAAAVTFWPPGGLTVAVLLSTPRAHWWRYLIAGLPGDIAISYGLFATPLPVGLTIYAGNVCEALAAAWLIGFAVRRPFRLNRVSSLFAFIGLGALAAPVLSATIGAGALALRGLQPFTTAWPIWWIGDAVGILTVAPAVLAVLSVNRAWPVMQPARWLEAALVAMLLLVSAHYVFSGQFPFLFLIIPALLWGALRFTVPGASLGILALIIMASRYTALGYGPFAVGAWSPGERQFLLQMFIGVMAASKLIIAVLTEQRREALEALQHAKDQLEDRVMRRTSELREREAELSVVHDRLVAALQSAPLLAFSQDRDLRYTWMHDSAHVLGVEAIAGRTDREVFPREADAVALAAIKRRVLESGESVRAEVSLYLRGAERWYDLSLRPYRQGDAISGILGVGMDVTERKQLEAGLRASHGTFRRLVQDSPFGVYVVDADFRLVEVSAGAQKVFENVRPLIGRDFAEVLHEIWPEPFADEAVRLFRHTLKTGEPYHAPNTVEQRNDIDAVESYDWKIERLVLPDGRFGVVCHFYDLSERQRYEAALREADRRKDEFLAILAHELRNPLAPISNAVQLLEVSGGAPELALQARRTIERQVRQMVRLVDDLLDVSRITRGKIELRKEHVSVATVLSNAAEVSRPLMEASGHQLTVTLPDDDLWLEADTTRVTQIVANLLNNAAKYTPDRGRVWLEARRDGAHARIRVRDSGIGIPAEMLPRIFEMFTQVDGSASRSHGGLGIGLTLARLLAEMHGGAVTAHSDGPGQGSEFTLRLPLAVTTSVQQETKAARPVRRDGERRRVLVVDDNHDSAESVGLLLETRGSEVRIAHDGPSALAVAREFHPEVALLDIGMPGMDGYEVARRMRGELPNVVLIAVTGWGQERDRALSRAAGFDHHCTKPVDPVAILDEALAARRVRAQPLA